MQINKLGNHRELISNNLFRYLCFVISKASQGFLTINNAIYIALLIFSISSNNFDSLLFNSNLLYHIGRRNKM